MRNINDFTIKEYYQFMELVNDNNDVFSLLELFGIKDPGELPIDKFNSYIDDIKSQTLSMKGVKREYKINGKKYKPTLNVLKLKAGQFIDLQHYMQNFKIEEVLSVFMLPEKNKKIFGQTKYHKYNEGYDPLKVKEEIYNHFKIGEANELSAFFLKTSINLLTLMKDSLTRKDLMERKKKLEENKLK